MIKILEITVQYAPLKDDSKEWIMDLRAFYLNGSSRHESWKSATYQGCLDAIPELTNRLNLEESYA